MSLPLHLLGVGLRAGLTRLSRRRLPQDNGRIYRPGLTAPVTIHRDRWGVPHVHAQSRRDLFFAQGFLHAQDRLWQLELSRRAANGQLSALFGPITLDSDRLSRTLGLARQGEAAWEELDTAEREDVRAYSDGINAFLDPARGPRPALPVEFTLLRERPAPWRPADSVALAFLQMWALSSGAGNELVAADLIAALGADKAADLAPYYPADHPITLPQGVDVNTLRLDPMLKGANGAFLGKGREGNGRGSNAWAIAPERSASGHALLGNDMHLPVGVPGVWYYAHLRSDDGYHVSGFTMPGLPYILAGRNDQIAWGVTMSYVDCEDLFVEQLHPDDPTRYRFRGEWRDAETREEIIPVRGQPDHREQVIVTHHGPLVSDLGPAWHSGALDSDQALALSATALEAEVSFTGFAALNEAENWEEFTTAVSQIQAPPLNLIYADRAGNIGYRLSGRVPIRAQGDGRTPAPGWDGEHEWIDFIPFSEMPHALNPASGYILNANEKIAGEEYPHDLGHTFRAGYRARRLAQLLNEREKISLADCRRWQRDVYSLPQEDVLAALADFEAEDEDAEFCLALLREWDGRVGRESTGPAVFHIFLTHLTEALLAPHLSPDLLAHYLGVGPNPVLSPVNEFQGYWLLTLRRWLAEGEPNWLAKDKPRREIIEKALADTVATLAELSDAADQWQWGRLHQITFRHDLGRVSPLDQVFNLGPYPIDGDSFTPWQTDLTVEEANGITASSRFLADLGPAAHGWALTAPGQSGQVGSPHYDDLVEPWRVGDYFPLIWREEEVTAVAQTRLILAPPLP